MSKGDQYLVTDLVYTVTEVIGWWAEVSVEDSYGRSMGKKRVDCDKLKVWPTLEQRPRLEVVK